MWKSLRTAFGEDNAEALPGVTMDINPLAAALHNPMATASIMAEPAPNAAVSVSAATPAQNNPASGRMVDSGQKGMPHQALEKALEKLNAKLAGWDMKLQFDIDPDLKQVVVSVVNTTSGEVVRKIPNDTELQITKAITKMIMELQGQVVNTAI